MTEDEQGFHNHLDQHPDDWDHRLVFGDWLEEQGRLPEAEAQRWMSQNRKHPRQYLDLSNEPAGESWGWESEWAARSLHNSTPHGNARRGRRPFQPDHYHLPDDVADHHFWPASDEDWTYPSRQMAETALTRTLQRQKQHQ